MQIKCYTCRNMVEVEKRELHTAPTGGKYYAVVQCETCKLLYKNLLDVMQDSLRQGKRALEALRARK